MSHHMPDENSVPVSSKSQGVGKGKGKGKPLQRVLPCALHRGELFVQITKRVWLNQKRCPCTLKHRLLTLVKTPHTPMYSPTLIQTIKMKMAMTRRLMKNSL